MKKKKIKILRLNVKIIKNKSKFLDKSNYEI